VAGYVAKDATKSTEGLGVTLDHRIGEAELEELDLPAHVAELDRACFELGSRRYSTTLTAFVALVPVSLQEGMNRSSWLVRA
jgi:hypothetical protein